MDDIVKVSLGGISGTGTTDMITINGHINADQYLWKVFEPVPVPLAVDHRDRLTFMDDNATPNSARVI